MTVTAYWYGAAFTAAFNKEIDWNEASKIKCALVTSSYTPSQDTHNYWDDVSGSEVASGGGYTTGGATMTTCTATYTGATNVFNLAADNVSWAASTITARYAVVYYDTGSAATSPLICYVDFGEDKSTSSGTFTITWNASGVAKVTIA